mmetsp:Transcript_12652/g.39928  ORF Transcript_12652/g.39928 Transcript_12652/m.39928 type:complete len:222 (+) Transcript_12652:1460-2125(+)
MDFLRLSKMRRPSSTPLTMEAKLSSMRIMSAASLETSLPAMPMATPMSPFLSAGASLTPSPVTATISPRRCAFSTMRSLWAGDTRAHTICSCERAASHLAICSSLSVMSIQSRMVSPLTTVALPAFHFSSSMIPMDLAMACAVMAWSPVTMNTLMRARLHLATASGTPSRGGSMREKRPAKVSPSVSKLGEGLALYTKSELSGMSLKANPSTRSPREPRPS